MKNNGFKALKRLRQETCPATYMPDFDKQQCCDTIEKELNVLKIFKDKFRFEFIDSNKTVYFINRKDNCYNMLLRCESYEEYETLKDELSE